MKSEPQVAQQSESLALYCALGSSCGALGHSAHGSIGAPHFVGNRKKYPNWSLLQCTHKSWECCRAHLLCPRAASSDGLPHLGEHLSKGTGALQQEREMPQQSGGVD